MPLVDRTKQIVTEVRERLREHEDDECVPGKPGRTDDAEERREKGENAHHHDFEHSGDPSVGGATPPDGGERSSDHCA
jgi:hypothetical protein